jgi:hypothetical protein
MRTLRAIMLDLAIGVPLIVLCIALESRRNRPGRAVPRVEQWP